MKTLIGIATFGNLPFTQLTINSIRETTKEPFDLFVVVGKPGDVQTSAWLTSQRIAHTMHEANHGFPVALNDLMDYAWGAHYRIPLQHTVIRLSGKPSRLPEARPEGGYDNLIIVGNDVVPYQGGVDALIEEARRTEWEWICSSQFDVKSLVARYPQFAPQFTGPNLNFEQWSSSEEEDGVINYTPLVRPWEAHQDIHPEAVQPDCIKDVRNLCLFKRSVFEKIGYADVNFWPGGYFEDNDYCTRARKAGVRACGLAHSAYFHFWSRTIHQGDGTQPRQFQNNGQFYSTKWGGGFDYEQFRFPFNGKPYELGLVGGPVLDGSLNIRNRGDEREIVAYWKSKA